MRIILCRWDEDGKVRFSEGAFPDENVLEWRGVTVFGELSAGGFLRAEAMELFSKVREMADADDDKSAMDWWRLPGITSPMAWIVFMSMMIPRSRNRILSNTGG